MSEQEVVKKLLEELRSHLGNKNQPKCLEKIEIIEEYFGSPLSLSEISKFFINVIRIKLFDMSFL